MITAHGATLTVTNEALILTPTPLAASLQGGGNSREVAIADIAGATSTPGEKRQTPRKVYTNRSCSQCEVT